MSKKRILSGNRPTGSLHLGHYFGALANWVSLQDDYDCFYFVADWHALTTEFENTGIIRPATLEMVMDWLAVGLDPDKSTIFVQSAVKEHAELYLLLGMLVSVARLERIPSYKGFQEETGRDVSNFGFLGYPLLQAADIMMYRAHGVPVGEDQVPHIEVTREFARRFNNLYLADGANLAEAMVNELRETTRWNHQANSNVAAAKLEEIKPGEGPAPDGLEIFPEPKALLTRTPKVPGLDGRKMSKSYGNSITLGEDPASIEQKIKTMITDPARKRRKDTGNPDVCPVYDLHKLYSDQETLMWAAEGCRTAGIGCLDCKGKLYPKINEHLAPIRDKREYYLLHPDLIVDVLQAGNAKARTFARETMALVRAAMKLE